MYMHNKKKIIICKFNLKNKCLYGEKCKFRHLNINELNDVLKKVEDLKQENELLKSELKGKCIEIRNLEKKNCDVTNDSVHLLAKPLYNSFFKKKSQNESAKIERNILKDMKIIVSTDDSGIDDEIDGNDNVISINKYKSNSKRSNQNLAIIQNKQIEIEIKLNHLEDRLNDSVERVLTSPNSKLAEIAHCVGVMKPLINCLIENQALLSKGMYKALQNINLNIDNGKLERWNSEANDKIMNLPTPDEVFH
jgi:hypothetical protein